jgi:hypothetical protein
MINIKKIQRRNAKRSIYMNICTISYILNNRVSWHDNCNIIRQRP